MPLLTRLAPDMRRRIAGSVATIRTDKPGHLIDQWYEEWQPDLITRIARLRDVDLAALDDQELDAAAEQALELMHRGIEIHFTLHGALMPILAELAFRCYELLGWSDQEVLELLAGLSSTSTQPAHRLAELARLAADRPAVSSLLTAVDRDSATRLADADPGFARAFDDYQRQFSCRALRYEIAEPSLAETPELALRLLADQVARTYDRTSGGGSRGAPRGSEGTCPGRPRRAAVGGRDRSERPWPGPNGPTRAGGQRVLHRERATCVGPVSALGDRASAGRAHPVDRLEDIFS
jgi:pyruvate,water dikinase